jgi:hypothetical protein
MKLSKRLRKLTNNCNGLLPVATDPHYLAKKLQCCMIPDKTTRDKALAKLGRYRVIMPKGFITLAERLKGGSKR